MLRAGDDEPESGQSCGLRGSMGFAGDREVAMIVRVNGASLI